MHENRKFRITNSEKKLAYFKKTVYFIILLVNLNLVHFFNYKILENIILLL